MLAQLDGPPVKVMNRTPSLTNLNTVISKIDNPDGRGLKASTIISAIKEVNMLATHPGATSQQKSQFKALAAKMNDMLKAAAPGYIKSPTAMGAAPIPGLPTSIPTNSTPNQQLSAFVWKGIDTTQATPRVFFYYDTPMGVFQSKGTPVANETAATDTNDMASMFNQMYSSINSWLTANGYAGSGNVQSAADKTGESKFSLAANTSDGYGGYYTGLNTYGAYLNTITNPNFVVHNPKQNLLKTVAKDVSTAAKAVVKEATKVVNTAVKLVKTVAMAPARIAFQGLVTANMFGLASSFKDMGSAKVHSFWGNFAPNDPTGLDKAIGEGSKHAAILGPSSPIDSEALWNEMMDMDIPDSSKSSAAQVLLKAIADAQAQSGVAIGGHVKGHWRRTGYEGDWNTQFKVKPYDRRDRVSGEYIGVAPLAAAAAAAAPILAAALDFLKKAGIITPTQEQKLNSAVATGSAVVQASSQFGTAQVPVPPTGTYQNGSVGVLPGKTVGAIPLPLILGGVGALGLIFFLNKN